jgi:hypothetical protein
MSKPYVRFKSSAHRLKGPRFAKTPQAGELELLARAVVEPCAARWLALRVFAALDDPRFIELATSVLITNARGRERSEALRYLRTLGAKHTLALARSWLGQPDGRGTAAHDILELHAEPNARTCNARVPCKRSAIWRHVRGVLNGGRLNPISKRRALCRTGATF